MAKRVAKPKSTAAKKRSPAQEAVHVAGKITGDLRNCLQNIRKTFLRIGQLLVEVRDGVSARLIEAIDQAIRVAENDLVVETADLHLLDERPDRRCLKSSLSRNSMLA